MIKNIGVDLDGTTYDFIGGLIKDIQSRFSYSIDPATILKYNLSHVTDSDEINRYILDTYHKPETYFNLQLFPGAQEAIVKLSKKYKVVIITTRPPKVRNVTNIALERDFPGSIDRVIFTTKKILPIRELRIRNMIDDNPTLAKQLTKHNIITWLIKAPYNHCLWSSNPDRGGNKLIRPVNSLLEAVNYIVR